MGFEELGVRKMILETNMGNVPFRGLVDGGTEVSGE